MNKTFSELINYTIDLAYKVAYTLFSFYVMLGLRRRIYIYIYIYYELALLLCVYSYCISHTIIKFHKMMMTLPHVICSAC